MTNIKQLSIFVAILLISIQTNATELTFQGMIDDVNFFRSLPNNNFGKQIMESIQLETANEMEFGAAYLQRILQTLHQILDQLLNDFQTETANLKKQQIQNENDQKDLQFQIDSSQTTIKFNEGKISKVNLQNEDNVRLINEYQSLLKQYKLQLQQLIVSRKQKAEYYQNNTKINQDTTSALQRAYQLFQQLYIQQSSMKQDSASLIEEAAPAQHNHTNSNHGNKTNKTQNHKHSNNHSNHSQHNLLIELGLGSILLQKNNDLQQQTLQLIQQQQFDDKQASAVKYVLVELLKNPQILANQKLVYNVLQLLKHLINHFKQNQQKIEQLEKREITYYQQLKQIYEESSDDVSRKINALNQKISSNSLLVIRIKSENMELRNSIVLKQKQLDDRIRQQTNLLHNYNLFKQTNEEEIAIVRKVIDIFENRFENVKSYVKSLAQ